jgi:hypothetical protein
MLSNTALSRLPGRHHRLQPILDSACLTTPGIGDAMSINQELRSNFHRQRYTMSGLLYQSARDYRALIRRLNKASPGYQGLHDFVNVKQDTCKVAPRFTILTIHKEEQQEESAKSSIKPRDFQSTAKLAEQLTHLQNQSGSCNIFLVENVCPESIALLGGFFDINPQFFADHVKNGDWFKDYALMDQLPALPSSQKWHDFLQVRFVQTLTVSKKSASDFDSDSNCVSETTVDVAQDPSLDYLVPDGNITRLPRKAGKLTPLARDDQDLDLLLCTKQNITVWFGKRGAKDVGWNGKQQISRVLMTLTFFRHFPHRCAIPASSRKILLQASHIPQLHATSDIG